MARVTGIGGIFFKGQNPDELSAWYRKHLDIEVDGDHVSTFRWREHDEPEHEASTVWSIFPHDTTYFGPGAVPFMINYRVADLDTLLEQLRDEGVQIDERRHDSEYGRFAWIVDPEGHRIELWQPAPGL
ncbi:MAG TPA: VOC family protein [Ktedonobacterales bacterium]|jgi:predicted enzyme related to lactoylglutathione lyase|nr:VOC family protein [Ktedonobacterales bacterium]